ncbi:MAG: hypothetical protein ACTSQC_11335 [Candidatus Heimdallarchaeaceae archaeon]
MFSKREMINIRALFLGTSIAFLTYSIPSFTDASYVGIAIGGICGSLIGGFVCGVFIYRKDWHFIGPIYVILSLGFALITIRFIYRWVWFFLVIPSDASIFLMVMGSLAFCIVVGLLIGYGSMSASKKSRIITQDKTPTMKSRQDLFLKGGVLLILGALFFLLNYPSLLFIADISVYIGTFFISAAVVCLAISIKELDKTTPGEEKKVRRTYITLIVWGIVFLVSQVLLTNSVLSLISIYALLPFVILLALIQIFAFFFLYQVFKVFKTPKNSKDRLILYFPLAYGFFAILKVVPVILLLVNPYSFAGYFSPILINYSEAGLLIVLGILFIIESKKQTSIQNEKNLA